MYAWLYLPLRSGRRLCGAGCSRCEIGHAHASVNAGAGCTKNLLKGWCAIGTGRKCTCPALLPMSRADFGHPAAAESNFFRATEHAGVDQINLSEVFDVVRSRLLQHCRYLADTGERSELKESKVCRSRSR